LHEKSVQLETQEALRTEALSEDNIRMEFHEYELQSQAEAYGAEVNTCREELCQYQEELKQYQSEAQAAQSNGQEPAAPTSHHM
jgi:hypothetical protein